MPRKRASPNLNRCRLHSARCIYCGVLATEDEHFPPYTFGNPGASGYLLRSCAECNGLAKTAHPTDFSARAWFVKNALRRKHKRRMSNKAYETTEANTDGGILSRRWVSEERAWRFEIKQRLAWDAVAYLGVICAEQGLDADDILGFNK
jgi:rRNA maturation protein Nop10